VHPRHETIAKSSSHNAKAQSRSLHLSVLAFKSLHMALCLPLAGERLAFPKALKNISPFQGDKTK
jgi:hypothetical protein